jgi:hypothetical protein
MTARSPRAAMAFVLLAALGIACGAGSRAPEHESAPAAAHAPESGRLWTDPVDFLALRTEYGDRSDYRAVCEDGRPVREWNRAAEAQDWPALLASTSKWLDGCPVDIDAHMLISIADAQTGQHVDAGAHATWFRGLVDSIVASGNGTSSDSPFVVISVQEEYALLRALHLQPKRQSLLNGGIDAIAVSDAEGREATMYFLPSAHWRRLEQELPGK